MAQRPSLTSTCLPAAAEHDPSLGKDAANGGVFFCATRQVNEMRFSHQITSSIRLRLFIAATLLVTVAVYAKGLFGSFVFDDFGNLVDNPAVRALDGSAFRWLALALSSNSGVLRRPLSMLSLGLDYRLFGLSPLAFKCTNLAIHLLNGMLIFSLGRLLAPRLTSPTKIGRSRLNTDYIALFGAAYWLIHPLNVSDVLYVVQRMNELATLFTLLGLYCYAHGRERMQRDRPGLLVAIGSVIVFGVLATLSKENGALIFCYALIIEWLCYGFRTVKSTQQLILRTFFVSTVALPILLFIAFVLSHPGWLAAGYAGRDFTLLERILSEARILWDYVLCITVPLPMWMGIFHDDFVVSRNLFQPPTTIFAIVGLLAVVAIAYKRRLQNPGLMFAITWFLVGHSMESSIIPLELIFEHRNYLPMAGLLLGTFCSLTPPLAIRVSDRRLFGICAVLLLCLAGLAAIRTNEWGSQLNLALAEVRHHPSSARAQYEAGRAIVFDGTAKGQQQTAEDRAIPYFERARALDSTYIFGVSSLILIRGGRGMEIGPELADLASRMRRAKQAQINPFLVVMSAAVERKIKVTPDQMEQLVAAVLDNPRYSATMRAMVLNNYGHYQFQVTHDNQAAVSLTVAAAALDPKNPLFEINLAKLALALGDVEQATLHLHNAEQLNKAGMYDASIANIKERLQIASH